LNLYLVTLNKVKIYVYVRVFMKGHTSILKWSQNAHLPKTALLSAHQISDSHGFAFFTFCVCG